MFTDNGKNQLLPFLLSMIDTSEKSVKSSLPETSHYFLFQNGLKSNLNHSDPISNDTVGVINIHHPIFKYDQECGPKGTQSIMNMMEKWKNESHIKGVVLDVNSSGGQASGTSEFAEYIDNYSKPVVTFTKDIIGSAAYYFASSSDAIIAHKYADFIGCIGSMFYSVNMEGILEKKGAIINEFYADISPDKNKQSRELKNGNERPLIEHILNPSAQQFQDDVKKYRPQISELALKGDIFSPSVALSEGLIDEIGTLESAIDKVFELAKKASNNNGNINKLKINKMSKLNVPLIEAVIGSSFSQGENETGVLLTDQQVLAIENNLAKNNTMISNASAKEKISDEKTTKLENENTTVTTAIQNALIKAGVNNAAEMTNEQGIESLSALITEYGSQDGEVATNPLNVGTSSNFEGSVNQKLKSTLNNL